MLREGHAIPDEVFDAFLPPHIRRLSARHWTPVDVAVRAVELLVVRGGMKILDIGSGAGKFCLVGALCSDAIFVGVEQRPHLVELAAHLQRWLRIDRARFIHGNVAWMDWREYDGFYFFNPFFENVSDGLTHIDDTIELSARRRLEYIMATYARLLEARPGARVVTYHGFGGIMPNCYRKVHEEPAGTDVLELWVRQASNDFRG